MVLTSYHCWMLPEERKCWATEEEAQEHTTDHRCLAQAHLCKWGFLLLDRAGPAWT